jgi:hypothetical protein
MSLCLHGVCARLAVFSGERAHEHRHLYPIYLLCGAHHAAEDQSRINKLKIKN